MMSGPACAPSGRMAPDRWLHPCRRRTRHAVRQQVASAAPERVDSAAQAAPEGVHLAEDAEVSRLDRRRHSAACERFGALSHWIARSRSSPPSSPAFP